MLAVDTSDDCPAICTEKFRQPCCPWCPLVDKEHPPYGTWELAAHLLEVAHDRRLHRD
jgi:hypothetical protein